MQLINQTPAQALAFRQFDGDGGLVCVVSARADFTHCHDASLVLSKTQKPFQYQDVFEGDPHATNMLVQSDLVPEKPGTDVTYIGTSYAPENKHKRAWTAEVQIGERLHKRLLVTGPRQWTPVVRRNWKKRFSFGSKPVLVGWKLSEPEPVRLVELGWDKAFGGTNVRMRPDDPNQDAYKDNPLGPGLLTIEQQEFENCVPAHQLDDPDTPVLDWRVLEGSAHGFGPIPPWWGQRQQYVGTYDAEWLEKRHPLLPDDFDPRFWQCAHPDLIARPYLAGDEHYILTNLYSERDVTYGHLPGMQLRVYCENGDDVSNGSHHLNLDGVHFDFRHEYAFVTLTWRCRFTLNEPKRAKLTLNVVVS